jgi:hypothetical protein
VTVPLVVTGHVMSQLLLDIKMSHLESWKTSNLLYDDSVGKLGEFSRIRTLNSIFLFIKNTKQIFGSAVAEAFSQDSINHAHKASIYSEANAFLILKIFLIKRNHTTRKESYVT